MQPTMVLRYLRDLFLKGLAFIAPIVITIALIVWLAGSFEEVIGGLLRSVLPEEAYVPGMGLVGGLGLILAVGLMANLFLVRWLARVVGDVLDSIPLVKSLYQGLRDVTRFFGPDAGDSLGRVVAVDVGPGRLVGFVMQEQATLPVAGAGTGGRHGTGEDGPRLLAVYLPMSYQIGGYTLYVAEDRVTALDAGAEDAMRAILTGGTLTGSRSRRH